jgi:hypothetical protein
MVVRNNFPHIRQDHSDGNMIHFIEAMHISSHLGTLSSRRALVLICAAFMLSELMMVTACDVHYTCSWIQLHRVPGDGVCIMLLPQGIATVNLSREFKEACGAAFMASQVSLGAVCYIIARLRSYYLAVRKVRLAHM